jgi:hypothetical protein
MKEKHFHIFLEAMGIYLGYPSEERIPASRFDETRIHFEQW